MQDAAVTSRTSAWQRSLDIVEMLPPPRRVRGEVILYAVLVAMSMAVVLVAALLEPADAWYGTHERLGLPPCVTVKMTGGYPCPTCGFTTALCRMARLEVWQALLAHPFGAVVFVAAVALLLWTAASPMLGRSPLGALGRMKSPWCWGVLIALYFGSWAFNIAAVVAGVKHMR